jgi:hypothetical protein
MMLAATAVAAAVAIASCTVPIGTAGPGRMQRYPIHTLRFPTGLSVPIATSADFTKPNDRITIGVVIVHGSERNADAAVQRIAEAAQAEGLAGQTLVLAPRFLLKDDRPAPEQHYWSTDGWSEGNLSQESQDRSKRLSSFEVVDRLCEELADRTRFPKLRRIAVIGHSAGGQFVNRYIAGAKIPDARGGPIEYVFVVANPSSYVYLDDHRPVPGGTGFAKGDATKFPGFDQWRYGLQGLNDYMRRSTPARIRANMFSRTAVYLGGSEDTARDEHLSTTPGSMAQGSQRFERWANYRRYVQLFPEWSKRARFLEVTGARHSGTQMFGSDVGRSAVFR